jgi:hypothetical protein
MNLRRPTMDMAQIVRWWPEAERVLALRERPAVVTAESLAYHDALFEAQMDLNRSKCPGRMKAAARRAAL